MQPSPEIEAIVRRLWSARKRGDLEVIDGLWSGSEYLLIIGSDQREWIEGSRESVMVAGKQIGEWPIEDSELLRLRAFEEGHPVPFRPPNLFHSRVGPVYGVSTRWRL